MERETEKESVCVRERKSQRETHTEIQIATDKQVKVEPDSHRQTSEGRGRELNRQVKV
jgi:hypothetical protein